MCRASIAQNRKIDRLRAEIQPAVAFDDTRFSFGFTDSFPWAGDPPREAVSAVGFYTPLRWLLPDEDPD